MIDPKVFILILNWNGYKDTIECLKSLQQIDYHNIAVVVVDNGSTDGSIDKIKKEFSLKSNDLFSRIIEINEDDCNSYINYKYDKPEQYLFIIRNNDNWGFAKGNNIGLNFVLGQGGEYVLLLNNDTVVEPDFLSKIILFCINNPEYVALTPKICFYNPKNLIWNCGGKLTWFGNRKYYFAGVEDKKAPQLGYKKITFITGCALFFKPLETGLLSENFFFGEEDFEFSMRLKQQGKRIACVFDSRIYHKVGSTVKSNSSILNNRTYIHYLNRFIDLKSFYSTSIWHFLVFINTSYAIIMLKIKHRSSVLKLLRMFKEIYVNAKLMNKFDKKDFEHALKRKF